MNNCILLLVLIIAVIFWYNGVEHFNEKTGQLCLDCEGKTFNECLTCNNCGFAVDKDGNSACIGGDVNGPYNYEDAARWYYNDPYSYMIQKNALGLQDKQYYKGPRQENRVIGIYPC